MSRATRTRDEVLVVGLGAVAQTHLTVLARLPDVTLVGGVDPSGPPGLTFRGRQVPVFSTLHQAAAYCAPTLVVIATPTATHAPVCRQARVVFPAAAILIEKPAAAVAADADELLTNPQPRIEVAYHMAYSPEVLWGQRLVQDRREELGPLRTAHAWFADPYEGDLDSARRRFATSWIDSGINALSVLTRFCDPTERLSLRSLGEVAGSMCEARVRCTSPEGEAEALIVTSWHVTDAARRTRLRFASGAELMLDHHAVAGYLTDNGQIIEIFGTDGTVPRRESHYIALYHRLLIERQPLMPPKQSHHLHTLLLDP